MTRLRGLCVSVAIGAGMALAGCGSDDEVREPLLIDWKSGTYEGVRLGDKSATLRGVVGRPDSRGRFEPFAPIGENFYDIGGLTNYHTPEIGADGDFETLRYPRVFRTTADRITSLGTTDHRARTPEGARERRGARSRARNRATGLTRRYSSPILGALAPNLSRGKR